MLMNTSASASVLSRINPNLAEAAKYVQSCGLPLELCQLTGNSSIELGPQLLGVKTPFSCLVNEAWGEEDGYIVSISISCVRQGGRALAFGNAKGALAQKSENPGDKPQWFSLSARVFLEEAPAGQERLLEDLVEYHEEARERELPITQRREEHPVWLRGPIRFTLAAGGKYGLVIDAIDLSRATWHGTSSGSAPLEPTTLDCEAVDDVAELFASAAFAAAPAAAPAGGISSRRKRASR